MAKPKSNTNKADKAQPKPANTENASISTGNIKGTDVVTIVGTNVGALRSKKAYSMRYRSAKVFIDKGFATLKTN